eukprot:TRINITY_DN67323_c5_g3_i1.p1 TRINITY_DN67323_c5_g3~~TRINITY_DN67323_c5_g3_i1.p1  ORF type:complete len:162 (-),score=10.53 TRINITY_DN67323_c5_g3_i1:202-687(-)
MSYYDEYEYQGPPSFPGSSQPNPDGVVDMYKARRDVMRGKHSSAGDRKLTSEEEKIIEQKVNFHTMGGSHAALSTRDYPARRPPLQSTSSQSTSSPLFGAPVSGGSSASFSRARPAGGYARGGGGGSGGASSERPRYSQAPLMSQPTVALPTRLGGRSTRL